MIRTTLIALAATAAGLAMAPSAAAQTEEFYVSEIIVVPFGFCPAGSFEADGVKMPIANNQALAILLGETYGKASNTVFSTPDLRSRGAVSPGQGNTTALFAQGDKAGAEAIQLTANQLPEHVHTATTIAALPPAQFSGPNGTAMTTVPTSRAMYAHGSAPTVNMNGGSVTLLDNLAGGSTLAVRDPYLAMRYCVVKAGSFPSRN
ncbi:tail fiber protein [Sphingomonas sp. AOB5]|uniref:phage tail protein n=1 Tax=Sphingomonas sp. AOB5 TaxID=3034017 RepID=UPI0023F759E3|nr:tail fiber protein [Sphingomonas sp. AOB5]MDF7775084.1 tail fiber protein [Sphingomonas sp. AOB5]